MTTRTLIALASAAILAAGCSNIERSRDLANPDVSGKTIAQQVCSNCHGVDGNPVSPQFPRLAGQQTAYLTAQLENFRGQHRLDPPGYQYMWGLSRHLTDAQVADLAAYYAAQPVRASQASGGDAATIARGRTVFAEGVPATGVIACQTCHGPDAKGMAAFPRLAGQHADYVLKQLNVFQTTHGRPGTPMDAVVPTLTDADKTAVAAYLQSLTD